MIRVDNELCMGCGECISVCPTNTLELKGDKAVVVNEDCFFCDHCVAVCPSEALSLPNLEEVAFNHFSINQDWLPFGKFDTSSLVHLMASRRSTRNFQDKPVEETLLDDLIKIGITAPSGTNSQEWTFTVLDNREKVLALGEVVGSFYERLNKMAGNTFLRKGLKFLGQGELDAYYQGYYETVKEGLRDWRENGRDLLFHGAPAVIVVGNKKSASCPHDDALLATQNILLAAHSLGLGTCLIGFVIEAAKRDKRVYDHLGIPKDERIYAAIAVGYPNEAYLSVTRRKKPLVRHL